MDSPKTDVEQQRRAAESHPVLIVDDEANIRTTLAQALEDMGLDVETAAHGDAALELLQDGRELALVLLDLRMPGLDGMEVLHFFKTQRPEVPVIVITAHGDVETAVQAVQRGAVDVLEKSIELATLRALIETTLDEDRQTQERENLYFTHIEEARRSIDERQLNAAVEQVHKALAIDALRPEAYNLMGVAMQLRRRIQTARNCYRAALAFDHGYASAEYNLENLSSVPRELSRYRL